MIDFHEGVTELDALLKYLRDAGCNQRDIANAVLFDTGKKLPETLSSSTISNARKLENHPRGKLILATLKKEFAIHKATTKLNPSGNSMFYRFELVSEKSFNRAVEQVNRDKKKKNRDAVQKEQFKQNKLALFQNKQYVLYDRSSEGIDRHVVNFHLNSKITIQHADPSKLYQGTYRLDGSGKYLMLSLSLAYSYEKAVEMMIPVGKTKAPDFTLGICVSTSESGDGVIGSTLVLVSDPRKEATPRSFLRRDKIPDNEVLPIIQRYLSDQRLNRIAVTKQGINSVAELKAWMDSKVGPVSQEASAKTEAYCGEYHMFYYSEGLQEYRVDIKNDLVYLEAHFSRIKPGETEWTPAGKGQVSLYANTLYIHLGEKDKRSFLQIGIGGTHVEKLQCFRGTVSGLDHYEQYMVSYSTVWVPKEVMTNYGADKLREEVSNLLRRENRHSIQVKSPYALSLKNLFSENHQDNYRVALSDD